MSSGVCCRLSSRRHPGWKAGDQVTESWNDFMFLWFLDYFHLFVSLFLVLINPVAGWNWRDGNLDWLVDLFLSKDSNFSFDKKQFSPWQVRKDPLHSDFHCHHRSGHFWYRSLVRLQLPHDVAGRRQGRTGKKILFLPFCFFSFSVLSLLYCSVSTVLIAWLLTCSVFAAWSWMIWLFKLCIMFDWQCVIAACLSGILNTEDNGRSSTASPTRRRPPFMLSSMWAPLCLAAQSKQFLLKLSSELFGFVKVCLVASCWISSSVDFLIMVHLPYLRLSTFVCIFANFLNFFVRSQHFFSKTSTQILYAKIVKLDGKQSLNTLSGKWYLFFGGSKTSCRCRSSCPFHSLRRFFLVSVAWFEWIAMVTSTRNGFFQFFSGFSKSSGWWNMKLKFEGRKLKMWMTLVEGKIV